MSPATGYLTSACTCQPPQIPAPVCRTRGSALSSPGALPGRAAAAGDAQRVRRVTGSQLRRDYLKIIPSGFLLLLLFGLVPEAAGQSALPAEGRVDLGHGDLYYQSRGTGNPLVLLHGYSTSGAVWNAYVDRLSQHFHVLVFDLPGHGRSDRISADFSHVRTAKLIVAALDSLDINEFSAAGHSSGAMVLLHLAKQHSERLRAGILIAGASKLPEAARRAGGQLSFESLPPEMLAALQRWHPNGEAQIRWLVAQQRKIAADTLDVNFSASELRALPMPILILHGDRDPLLPLQGAIEMHEQIPGSSLLVVPNTGHDVLLRPGLEPALLAEIMVKFFRSLSP